MERKNRQWSLYMDSDFPIPMKDVAHFMRKVDSMFIALSNGALDVFFAFNPKMMEIMDKLHTWGEKYGASTKTKID